MAKFVCYDAQLNKMTFTVADANVQLYKTTYESANSLWPNGYGYQWSSYYEWLCGTNRQNDGLQAWFNVMKDYAPYSQLQPLSSLLKGFTVAELVERGLYTPGTTKTFYLTQDLSNYIRIETDNITTNGWNYTVYQTCRVYLKFAELTEEIGLMASDGGTTINFGLLNGSLDGINGYYFFSQSAPVNGGLLCSSSTCARETSVAYKIKNIGGKPPVPPSVSPANDPLGLWDGDGIGTGDDITMPGAPDETISGAMANGFLNIYSPSASQLRAFGGLLWTNAFNTKWYDLDSISNLVLNAVSDPINYIVGLFMLPITPSTTGSSGIYLGGINANTVTAPRVSSQFKTINFGTINISELYGNYLDYSNSRLSIYLPYVGTADLDIQEVNAGSVELQYTVDCFTGACVANVRCVKSVTTPWGEVYTNKTVHSYSGNMAIQLPISAGSFDTMMNGLVNIGLGLGTNSPAMIMSGSKDVMTGFTGDVTTRGSLSSNTGKLSYQTPYLMFTRPIESLPAKVGNLHGYGSGSGGKLGSFSGYVVCSDVKLDGITATDSELNEIENYLKSGVYV